MPLCPAWLSLFMRRGETDGQISTTTRGPQHERTAHPPHQTLHAQKTYAETALELGARGRSNEARDLVEAHITDPRWRCFSERAFVPTEPASDLAHARRLGRAEVKENSPSLT